MAENLLLMFDRLSEPIYVPKGEKKVVFDVPPEYLPDEYQGSAANILSRFGEDAETTVPIKKIAIPNLGTAVNLPREENFSLFIPKHREMSDHLIKVFLGMRTVEDLISLAAYCRDRLNPQLFVYALSVVLLHRPDTKHLKLPSINQVFPEMFVETKIFTRARIDANVAPNGVRTPIEIPFEFTASRDEPEQRVAFFREDLGVNLHHFHWHILYPFSGPTQIVNKDRRGELFYYMHHQVMARYNTERLSNLLPRTRPLNDLRAPIPEGYFPKLDQTVAGRAWPSRPANMILQDVNRPVDGVNLSINSIEIWRSRIIEAIQMRAVRTPQGQLVALDETTGINILANTIESSIFSADPAYYGDLHNSGHMAMSFIHDPQHRYLESFSVIAASPVSMRDPVFYRWHEFMDDLFFAFKDSLPPYTAQDLVFPNVAVASIQIVTPGSNPNTLNTHWNRSTIDLSGGLDFAPRGAVLARVQHLNHDEFFYNIIVNNFNNFDVVATVRIFMAPKYGENGQHFSYNEQRRLMIEMDKFIVQLRRGQNMFARSSVDSSVTIPYETTFSNENQTLTTADSVYCGCGWPQHMLLPRGTTQGYPMDLFVMLSNYETDRVNQGIPSGCTAGVSFCGLRDLLYPDRRPMGFPFDRAGSQRVRFLTEFVTANMGVQTVTVRFQNVLKARQPPATMTRVNTGDSETSTRSDNKVNEVVPMEFSGAPVAVEHPEEAKKEPDSATSSTTAS